jgi:hypothetical protein
MCRLYAYISWAKSYLHCLVLDIYLIMEIIVNHEYGMIGAQNLEWTH